MVLKIKYIVKKFPIVCFQKFLLFWSLLALRNNTKKGFLGESFLLILILLFSSFCAFARQDYPKRIISLGPSITKALYLLGAQDKLIANTTYCIYPPAAKEKEKIGTALEVNIERIFYLKPDLVLATSLTNPKTKEKLKNLGIEIITFSAPKDFSGLCKQFLELGKLLGKEENAEKIVKNAENKVDSIKKQIKDLPNPKVFIQVGAKPLVAANGSYFVNDYIESAGGINIAKQSSNGIYSKEQLLRDNPDIIIITRMGMISENEKKEWQSFKALNAVKLNQIHIVDTDELTSPTPLSFVDTLEEMVQILHPEIKNEK